MSSTPRSRPLHAVVSPLRSFIRHHRFGRAVMAGIIGSIVGLASVLFHYCIEGWTWVMTGYADYTHHVGAGHGVLGIGRWFVIFTPVISGLIYGPIIRRWAPSARGHGIPEVMLAVKRKGGYIPGQVAIVKILASALTLGGGGSVGREGPIVQVGASLGSTIARRTGLTTQQVILFAGCGSAAGIAATFNAPFAGAVFALEVILSSFTSETFGMVVISAVTASLTSHLFLPDTPVVAIPTDLHVFATADFIWIIIIGLFACLAGLGFSKLLYWVEDVIDSVYTAPEWARPAIGGLVIGGLLFLFPSLYGSSYPIQLNALQGHYTIGFLLMLAAGRMLYTSLTIAFGGSGGVFAPTLFIGAVVGAAFGQFIEPLSSSSPAVYGVIGMGAAFAGAARAPFTGVLIIVEMTGQYGLIMPMMLAVAIATGASQFLARTTIYTAKLVRRGDILDDPVERTLVGRVPARSLATPIPTALPITCTIEEANQALLRHEVTRIPVVDDHQRFCGCFTSLLWANVYADGVPHDAPLSSIDLDQIYATGPMMPSQVLESLVDNNASAVVVIDEDAHIEGWITQQSLVSMIYAQQQRALQAGQEIPSLGHRIMERYPRLQSLQKNRKKQQKK